MIDPEDGDVLGWSPKEMECMSDIENTYKFLVSLPLYAKKDMFQSMNKLLGKHPLSDIFQQPEQVNWATGIIKLGMQLPVEDVGLATQAFNLYTDALFTISPLYSISDSRNATHA
ncbi:hypothetical protein H4S06_004371, partial [Coemansia sp. BCRC 34490]